MSLSGPKSGQLAQLPLLFEDSKRKDEIFLFTQILYILCILQKFFCLLISVQSLSILVTVFMEAVPAPVLLYAYYSRFNFAMLRVAMLKDMPRKFYAWGVFKNFCQKFGQFCIEMVKSTTVTERMLNPLQHDQR